MLILIEKLCEGHFDDKHCGTGQGTTSTLGSVKLKENFLSIGVGWDCYNNNHFVKVCAPLQRSRDLHWLVVVVKCMPCILAVLRILGLV